MFHCYLSLLEGSFLKGGYSSTPILIKKLDEGLGFITRVKNTPWFPLQVSIKASKSQIRFFQCPGMSCCEWTPSKTWLYHVLVLPSPSLWTKKVWIIRVKTIPRSKKWIIQQKMSCSSSIMVSQILPSSTPIGIHPLALPTRKNPWRDPLEELANELSLTLGKTQRDPKT